MFFLVPRVTLVLLVVLVAAMAWRAYRQRGAPPRPPRGRAARRLRRRQAARTLLVPAALMKGADRTWIVFGTADSDASARVARHLADAEPGSQVTQVDVRREPRLAEAFGVTEIPEVLLANRYGQIEARLAGSGAIDAYDARHR